MLPTETLSAKSCLPSEKLSHMASRWYMACRRNRQEGREKAQNRGAAHKEGAADLAHGVGQRATVAFDRSQAEGPHRGRKIMQRLVRGDANRTLRRDADVVLEVDRAPLDLDGDGHVGTRVLDEAKVIVPPLKDGRGPGRMGGQMGSDRGFATRHRAWTVTHSDRSSLPFPSLLLHQSPSLRLSRLPYCSLRNTDLFPLCFKKHRIPSLVRRPRTTTPSSDTSGFLFTLSLSEIDSNLDVRLGADRHIFFEHPAFRSSRSLGGL